MCRYVELVDRYEIAYGFSEHYGVFVRIYDLRGKSPGLPVIDKDGLFDRLTQAGAVEIAKRYGAQFVAKRLESVPEGMVFDGKQIGGDDGD